MTTVSRAQSVPVGRAPSASSGMPRPGFVEVGRWRSAELPGTGAAQADWAAQTLLAALDVTPAALHVVTADAGACETLAFWEEAHERGFALASPMAFPWTLANSPTGRISSVLGITGPCTTHLAVGPEDEHTWQAVIHDALDDVAEGSPAPVLVVRLHGTTPITCAGGPVTLELSAVVVS